METNPLAQLQLDKDGNIIAYPVQGWISGTAGKVGVILAVQYLTNDEGGSGQVQLALMPQQALELAEKLTTLANKLMKTPVDRPN